MEKQQEGESGKSSGVMSYLGRSEPYAGTARTVTIFGGALCTALIGIMTWNARNALTEIHDIHTALISDEVRLTILEEQQKQNSETHKWVIGELNSISNRLQSSESKLDTHDSRIGILEHDAARPRRPQP